MRFDCPRCGHDQIKLTDEVCPKCQLVLSLSSLLRHYWQRTRTGLKRAAVVRCPRCGRAVPLNTTACACGVSLALGPALDVTLQPSRERWSLFLKTAKPGHRRLIQWVLLLGSVALLVWLLPRVEAQYSKQWLPSTAVAIGYLAVGITLTVRLAPSRVVQGISQRAALPVKLALLALLLSGVLLLQWAIKAWWGHALFLGGVIVATSLGVLLSRWLLGRNVAAEPTVHTATRPQGRKAVID